MNNVEVERIVKSLTEYRVGLDCTLGAIDTLKGRQEAIDSKTHREIAMAYTSIQVGRMWVGELLFCITGKYPYTKTASATTAKEIEEAVDVASEDAKEAFKEGYAEGNFIGHVNYLREYLDEVFKYVLEVSTTDTMNIAILFNLNSISCLQHLKEARMNLGLVLGKIRDNG